MRRFLLVAAVGVLSACSSDVSHSPAGPSHATLPAHAANAAIDPRADAILRKMSDTLAGASTICFSAAMTGQEMIDTGQIAEFSRRSEFCLHRPDRLYVQQIAGDERWQFWYKGSSLTITDGKSYATVPAEGHIDQMLDAMAREYDMVVPLADLTLPNPYEALVGRALTGSYIGAGEVGGVACDHLAFTSQQVDWQIWVQKGSTPLPRKIVIDYKLRPGRPEFVAILSDWNLTPGAAADAVFDPQLPPGAQKLAMSALLGVPERK